MSEARRIELGHPAILAFRGPDALRYLNGQVTQDVRRVIGGKLALPSCVTDAKGRLQFRVHLLEADDASLWVVGPEGADEALEARLTRYLIADDVECENMSGRYVMVHLTAPAGDPPPDAIVRESFRFGVNGSDCFLPIDKKVVLGDDLPRLEGDALEHFRIANRIPAWGAELAEGMLPPEAGLDATDVSYTKGCYIGQEVISRIKSAGKVNRRLTAFRLGAAVSAAPGDTLFSGDVEAGVLTSISPLLEEGTRPALGYVKRGHDPAGLELRDAAGGRHPISLA